MLEVILEKIKSGIAGNITFGNQHFHLSLIHISSEQLKEVLYAPEGKVQLNMNEMLDEWGREFFAEGRRRIDLIRFGKFSTGRWWDKIPDADNHCQIFPLIRQTLDTNSKLVQNPGY